MDVPIDYFLAGPNDDILLYFIDKENDNWTNIEIPNALWYAFSDEDYNFKFAVQKYSNKIIQKCYGSIYVYWNAEEEFFEPCDKWTDPLTSEPAYVIEFEAKSHKDLIYEYDVFKQR
jgi:hypothetical protein